MCVLTGNHHPFHHAFFFLRQDQTRRQQSRQIVTTPVETNRNPSLIIRMTPRALSLADNRVAHSTPLRGKNNRAYNTRTTRLFSGTSPSRACSTILVYMVIREFLSICPFTSLASSGRLLINNSSVFTRRPFANDEPAKRAFYAVTLIRATYRSDGRTQCGRRIMETVFYDRTQSAHY